MKTHTKYLTFNTKKRQEIIDITEEVEACRAAADIEEGFVLVSAMHISASVFVNDHESGLWKDILDWLENDIAPWLGARERPRRRCSPMTARSARRHSTRNAVDAPNLHPIRRIASH